MNTDATTMLDVIERAYNRRETRYTLTDNLVYWIDHVKDYGNTNQIGWQKNSCLVFLLPLSFNGAEPHVDVDKLPALDFWLPEVIDVIATDAYFEEGYDASLEYLRPLRGNLKRGVDESTAFRTIIHAWVDNVLYVEFGPTLDASPEQLDELYQLARTKVIDAYFQTSISEIRDSHAAPLSQTEQRILIALYGISGKDLHDRILRLHAELCSNPHLNREGAPDEGHLSAISAPLWEVLDRYAGLPIGKHGCKLLHPTAIIDRWTSTVLESWKACSATDPAETARLMLLVRDAVYDQYCDLFIEDLPPAQRATAHGLELIA
jgi:hypothetical protein